MAEEKKVTLALEGFRIDAFDPSVEGVPPITAKGTKVPESREKEVREQAKKSGLSVRKVS